LEAYWLSFPFIGAGLSIDSLKLKESNKMLELLVLIVGIGLFWKFGPTLSAISKGAEINTQVWSEEVIADAVIDRVENMEEYDKRLNGREAISHDEVMAKLKVD
jgi:hypothetical protein